MFSTKNIVSRKHMFHSCSIKLFVVNLNTAQMKVDYLNWKIAMSEAN